MNKNRNIPGLMLIALLVLASTVSVVSQQPRPAPGAPGDKTIPGQEDAMRYDTLSFVNSEISFDGKVVKGAPYSAQAVTENIQTLSDGNRIINKSTALLYRDSEGRTRREQTLNAIGPFEAAFEGPQTIIINDPVAQMSYTLDVRTHTARKMPSFRFEVTIPVPVESGRTRSGSTGNAPNAAPERVNNGDSYVMSTRPAAGGGYTVEYRGGPDTVKTESLGKQTIEGVEATGTRNTATIPAGQIGNDLPIEIVNERWYSNELQTTIMTRHRDPRFGESTYRLTNIDRSEPAKSLFEIPPDYTVKGPGSNSTLIENSGGQSGRAPISGGVLNGKTISMPQPEMPVIARAAHASGEVDVQVTVDEEGNVIAAKAISGHPLLQAAAVTAARQAKFTPTRLSGQAVKVQGILVYNFTNE